MNYKLNYFYFVVVCFFIACSVNFTLFNSVDDSNYSIKQNETLREMNNTVLYKTGAAIDKSFRPLKDFIENLNPFKVFCGECEVR